MPSFAPEVIFHLGSFPVTNTILNTILVDIIILSFALVASRKLSLVPAGIQNLTEYLIESFYNLTSSIAGKRTNMIFPFFMTFFLFILVANFTNLIPGLSAIGFDKTLPEAHGEHHFVPILRGTTSDLNTTLALALVSLTATHILSIRILGVKEYLSRFVPLLSPILAVFSGKLKFKPSPKAFALFFAALFNMFILSFVGVLEIVSEFVKVVSLSFRLFGNIYAGEVVLHTISGMVAFIAPLPFLLLEVIVSFVQALVFSMLTLVFMVILTTPHHEEASEEVSRT